MKLILTFVHEVVPEVPKIPTAVSLAFIIVTLTITTVASLVKASRDPSAHAHSGALHGHKQHAEAADAAP